MTIIKIFLVVLFTMNQVIAKDTLTIWTSNEFVKKAIDGVAPEFEKTFKTKVKVDVLSKDVTNQFKTAALTGQGPDILAWAHDVVGELAESGLVEPIVMAQNKKDEFIKVAIDAFTYRGKVYGYPYDLEALGLIINKDLVKEDPKSFEEIYQIAKSFRTNKNEKEKYGFLYDFKSLFFSFGLLSANGGYIFKNNQGSLNIFDVGVNSESFLEGLTFLSMLTKEGIIPTSTDRSIAFEKMKQGKLAITIDGPWAISDLKASKINYKILPLPTINGHIARPFVGSHGFIIRRSSKHKELAKEFIEKFLITKKGIKTLYDLDPRGPSRNDVLAEVLPTAPDLAGFMESAKNGIPMPNVPQMGAVWAAMGANMGMGIDGKMTIKDALNQAQTQILKAVQETK